MKNLNTLIPIACLSLLIWAAIGIATFSPTPVRAQPAGSTVRTWEIPPTLLTVSTKVDLCSLPGGPVPCTLSNPAVRLCNARAGATTATTITLCDKQVTPVCFWNAVPIAANSTYDPMVPNFAPNTVCELWPNGVTITAGNANTLVFQARGTYVANGN